MFYKGLAYIGKLKGEGIGIYNTTLWSPIQIRRDH